MTTKEISLFLPTRGNPASQTFINLQHGAERVTDGQLWEWLVPSLAVNRMNDRRKQPTRDPFYSTRPKMPLGR